jgi:hypothetical protein
MNMFSTYIHNHKITILLPINLIYYLLINLAYQLK